MPSLSELTDAYTPQETVDSFPVESPFTSVPIDADGVRRVRIDTAPPKPEPSFLDNIGMAGVDDKSGKSEHPLLQQLFGLGGETRYQLWPERMVREGLSAAGDVMSGKVPQWAIDPETGDVHTSPNMVEKAQEMSALAGTGGLAGMTTDATLGATPFLRPALKYKDKLYKGKDGQQHLDVIPESIYPEFQKKAMSGEDINEFKFGFVNDKGHFLDRETALKYGIDTGLVDPQAGKFGALTSTLMADSSKPGIAIESMKQAKITNLKGEKIDAPRVFYRGTNAGDERRITTGIDAWDKHTFAADNLDAAKMYGKDIATYEAKPDAKILYEGTKEFNSIAGKIKKDENLLQYSHRAAEAAKAAGYDAAWFKRQGDVGTAIFNPDKFILRADNQAGVGVGALKQAQPFFSAVEHNVNAIPQAKMTGDQWLGTLSNKPGVKPEEMQWSGLSDFLKENKGKPVTKEQIVEHLNNNKIELKEVNKGQYSEDTVMDQLAMEKYGRPIDKLTGDEIDHIATLSEQALGSQTKYHDYQLPGGENYREMLLTLPEVKRANSFDNYLSAYRKRFPNADSTDAEVRGFYDKGVQVPGEGKLTSKTDPDVYKSSHWDEPNILAHVRMNDRTIDGKKSLHLEEIQSDWHQQGRDKGYKEAPLPVRNFKTYLAEEKGITDPAEMRRLWDDRSSPEGIALHNAHLAETEARAGMNIGKVPDAPFKKSWHELALKRMLREAAEVSHKSEVAHWEKMVQTNIDDLAHRLVKSGKLREICE